MQPIQPSQVKKILEVTDRLGLHREGIVIPLAREGEGRLARLAGAKVEITAPEGQGFDAWLERLPALLTDFDLSGIPRIEDEE